MRFTKYHGTGNDFILIDDRDEAFDLQNFKNIALLCNRHIGIGADGLIIIRKRSGYDFEMLYYNSDGNPSSMCGNGGRCAIHFASFLGLINKRAHFFAPDGAHNGEILSDGRIKLEMQNSSLPQKALGHWFINTGSPHFVELVQDVHLVDVRNKAPYIRHHEFFGKGGTNVNFISQTNERIWQIRTFERGVEDETLSCGTGACAAALVVANLNNLLSGSITLETQCGFLEVNFQRKENGFENIELIGPVQAVFEGSFHQTN